MKNRYSHTIEAKPIRPGSQFPVDMLRYDGCTPERETDSSAIVQSIQERDVTLIRLRKTTPYKEAGLTYARWQSFGWTAEIVETRSI
jgi:hypothetical protein